MQYFIIPLGAGKQFLGVRGHTENFCTSLRARAKIFSMSEDFKKLSGLRVVFILPYAVPVACHSIPNYVILVIDLFFAIVPWSE